MNNSYKKLCAAMVISISLMSNTFVFAENNEDIYIKENKLIIENLNANLSCAPHTGNLNLDYLYQMIHQNQGAINMAKTLLNNNGDVKTREDDNKGINELVDQIAKDTIKNETVTIVNMENVMQTLINNLSEDKIKERSYMNEYNTVLKEMISTYEGLKSTGDINKDFLETMIVNKQATIGMANAVIIYTDNEEVKKIAQNEINTKKAEIDNMKNILANNKDTNKDKKNENNNTK